MVNPLDKGVAELGVAAKAKPLSAAAANTYDSFRISKLLDYAPLRREPGALVHRRLNFSMVPRWGMKTQGARRLGVIQTHYPGQSSWMQFMATCRTRLRFSSVRRILLVDLVLATGADPLKSAMTSTCGRFLVEHLQVNGQTHVMVVKQPSLSRMGNASLQTSYTRGILATAINRSQKSAELTRLG